MKRPSSKFVVGAALLTGGVAVAIAGPKVVGDPAKAEPIVKEACASCHGEDGNSPNMPNLPKLAGQHAGSGNRDATKRGFEGVNRACRG